MLKVFKRSAVVIHVLLAMALLCTTGWAADESIGSVKTVTGEAHILRGEQVVSVNPGTLLFVKDVITTGADGSVGIILRDDSLFSLGPDSLLELKEFLFEPMEGDYALGAKFVHGSFSYLTGKIGKLAPKAVKLETPSGTIAIRGTHLAIEVKK